MVWHVLRNGTLISLPHKRKTHQRCMRWARNASGPCWRGLTRGTASWLAVVSAVTPPHHHFGQSKARGRLRRRPLAIGGFRFLASRERWQMGRVSFVLLCSKEPAEQGSNWSFNTGARSDFLFLSSGSGCSPSGTQALDGRRSTTISRHESCSALPVATP
jgi:hypothetical protein